MTYSPLQLFLDSLRPPIEAQLLTEFAQINEGSTLLEIGCGRGYIPYRLAALHPDIESITAIDVDFNSLKTAVGRFSEFLSLTNRPSVIQFVCADARQICFLESAFDAILCNPPFFSNNAGRPSQNQYRHQARHDVNLSLQELFRCAQFCIKPNGTFFLIFPKQRINEIQKHATDFKFKVSQMQEHPEIRKRCGGVVLFSFLPHFEAQGFRSKCWMEA